MSAFTSSQSQLTEAQAQDELQTLVAETTIESDVDLDFIYTRDIEFRQETIYFIVVDRFNDGDPENSQGANPELYDPEQKEWASIGEATYRVLSTN